MTSEPGATSDHVRRRVHAQAFIDAVARTQSPWLSVVIPACDEERRILPTLLSVVLWLRNRGAAFEVIVVDDGSRDATAEIVTSFVGEHPEVRLVRLDGNRGKGAAVREGMRVARGAWLLMNDADGATPIPELDRLLLAAADGVDVVIGSRALNAAGVVVERRLLRHVVGRVFAQLVQLLAVSGIRDTQCGFKLFRRTTSAALFSAQRLDRFGFDVELLFLARRARLRIVEVGVSWNDVQGSKVSLAAGINGFLDVLRVRWLHRAGR